MKVLTEPGLCNFKEHDKYFGLILRGMGKPVEGYVHWSKIRTKSAFY